MPSFTRRLIFSLGTTALFLVFSSFLTIPFAGVHPIEEVFEAKNTSAKEIDQAQRIEDYLKTQVPGLNYNYREILDMITHEGHDVWIIGGTIRDLLSPDENSPKDLDFTFDCSLDDIEAILTKNRVPYTRILEDDVINIGTKEGGLEGVESSFSLQAKDENLEFTVNTIHYHLNSATFEPRFKEGLKDLKEKKITVSTKNLNEWLYAGQSERPIKIFRYWKMRGKGYLGLTHLERFIIIEATKAYRKDPEAFKENMLQYLGSHFSSFDEINKGCSLTMGSKWCQENVTALYAKAKPLSTKIDSMWNKERYSQRETTLNSKIWHHSHADLKKL